MGNLGNSKIRFHNFAYSTLIDFMEKVQRIHKYSKSSWFLVLMTVYDAMIHIPTGQPRRAACRFRQRPQTQMQEIRIDQETKTKQNAKIEILTWSLHVHILDQG